MANSVIARNQGDDFQARYFWLEACRLFHTHSKVERVAFEYDPIKSFDDVVVFYSTPITDQLGKPIVADCYQIKYHVTQNGYFTCQSLIEPEFINATTVSLLQRLLQAQQAAASIGNEYRFTILSPWPIHPDDPLAVIVGNSRGEIRLDKLFDGTGPRGRMGKIRHEWRQHLDLSSEDELKPILACLSIEANYWGLDRLREYLNLHMQIAGMLPVATGQAHYPYDDLIRKLKAQGRNVFNRAELQEILKNENLWTGTSPESENAVQIGIRSFLRRAEHMEDETIEMLDLVPHFDGRFIQDPMMWQKLIFPKVSHFLSKYETATSPHHLLLDTHSSIAFAAGYCLEVKAGANVIPVQKFQHRKQVWDPIQSTNHDGLPDLVTINHDTGLNGNEIAVAISVTHNVLTDVREYVAQNLPQVGRIIECYPHPKPGYTSIKDASHAFELAQKLSAIFRQRTASERSATLHLFASAPNGFMFFLGQMAHSFGVCVCYEFDFDTCRTGSYQPSLKFPPSGFDLRVK